MKFSINKQRFNSAIQIVSKAIVLNSPIPQLAGIKLDVLTDKLVLTASDSDLSIVFEMNALDEENKLSIFSEGSLVIDTRYLSEIVRKFEGDTITFELIDGTLAKLTDEQSDFNVNGIKAASYPLIDFSKPEIEFEFDASVLQKIIQQTLFATSDKETRPVLTGVNFNYHSDEKLLTVIATDSYRLAQKKIKLTKVKEDFNITIPSKVLGELIKILESKKKVLIALNQKKIQFNFDNLCIQSRLLDGIFPETRKLIPTEFISEFTVSLKQFYNCIDRASFIKQDGVAIVVLRLEDNMLHFSNNSLEMGSYKEDMVVSDKEGSDIKVSFSCRFLMESLRSLNSTDVKIKFSGEMKPAVLINPEDDSIIQLVLPIRSYD